MATRTVKIGLATYKDADGNVGAFGMRGQEVDVHESDLKRFDALNSQPGEADDAPDPDPVDYTVYSASGNRMVSPAAGEENSGVGSGLNDDVSEEDVEESGTAEEDARAAENTDAPARRRPRKAAGKRRR